MKDIPMFTTEHGVASLVLKEIPARKAAYVKLLSAAEPSELLQECVDFCRACGAESIYASGDFCPAGYPCTAVLIQMQRSVHGLEQADGSVLPVTDETIGRWREIYNDRMSCVPNASYMTAVDEKKYLAEGDCYFVHRDGCLLGIGKAGGDTIHALASVQPGAGRAVVLALASVLSGETVKLTVARENTRAVAMYEKLGFVAVQEVSRWYKIL